MENKAEYYNMPNNKETLGDKKFDTQLFGKVQIESLWNKEQAESSLLEERYIYADEINMSKWAKELNTTRQRLTRNLKYLVEMEYVEYYPGDKKKKIKPYYKVKNSYEGGFELIEGELLRILIASLNTNALKTYLIYRMNTRVNGSYTFGREYVCDRIGLSSRVESSLQTVTDINRLLEKCGLIEVKKYTDNNKTKQIIKTIPFDKSKW